MEQFDLHVRQKTVQFLSNMFRGERAVNQMENLKHFTIIKGSLVNQLSKTIQSNIGRYDRQQLLR